MPAVVLLTIKWIGIIVGCVLAMALLLVLSVLFVPIRYRILGNMGQEKQLKVRVSWLFHILHLSILIQAQGESHKLYLFGIPLKKKKKKPIDLSEEKKRRKSEKKARARQEDAVLENPKQASREHLVGDQTKETKAREKSRGSSAEDSLGNDARPSKGKKGFFLSFGRRLGTIRDRGRRVWDMLRDDNTPQAMAFLVENAGRLLRHIRPSRVKGWIHFGTSDPALTGQILGAVSVLFALWGRGLTMTPDFEEKVLEGEVDIGGRLQLVVLLIILVRVLPDKRWQRWKRQFDAINV